MDSAHVCTCGKRGSLRIRGSPWTLYRATELAESLFLLTITACVLPIGPVSLSNAMVCDERQTETWYTDTGGGFGSAAGRLLREGTHKTQTNAACERLAQEGTIFHTFNSNAIFFNHCNSEDRKYVYSFTILASMWLQLVYVIT